MLNNLKYTLKIYTDASYDNSCGFCGYSFLILKDQKIVHEFSGLACASSSANAELFAVISALEFLVNTRNSKTNSKLAIDIFVDYSPITKQSIRRKSYLFKYLDSLKQKFKQINIVWVKGHSENSFNILVDKRARKILREHIKKTPIHTKIFKKGKK